MDPPACATIAILQVFGGKSGRLPQGGCYSSLSSFCGDSVFWSFGERRTYASKFPSTRVNNAPCDQGEAQQVHQLGRHLPNGG